jgi:hypothetical protein
MRQSRMSTKAHGSRSTLSFVGSRRRTHCVCRESGELRSPAQTRASGPTCFGFGAYGRPCFVERSPTYFGYEKQLCQSFGIMRQSRMLHEGTRVRSTCQLSALKEERIAYVTNQASYARPPRRGRLGLRVLVLGRMGHVFHLGRMGACLGYAYGVRVSA